MRPTLVFDADDTLWDEQGLLQSFEARIEALLDRLTGTASRFRERFIAIENENIPTLGYGLPSYVFSAAEAVAQHPQWRVHKPAVLDLVAELVVAAQSAGPRVIGGVVPTLERLRRANYRMVLLTRGLESEQRAKLERSGLGGFFADILVVARKERATYLATGHALGDATGATLCMIGNSMRSDIEPALAAGWRAIHVPAPHEWAHDAGRDTPSARFRRAERFPHVADLIQSPDFWSA